MIILSVRYLFMYFYYRIRFASRVIVIKNSLIAIILQETQSYGQICFVRFPYAGNHTPVSVASAFEEKKMSYAYKYTHLHTHDININEIVYFVRMVIISATAPEFTFGRKCAIILRREPPPPHYFLRPVDSARPFFFFFHLYYPSCVFIVTCSIIEMQLNRRTTIDSDLISPETIPRQLRSAVLGDPRRAPVWLSFNLFFGCPPPARIRVDVNPLATKPLPSLRQTFNSTILGRKKKR